MKYRADYLADTTTGRGFTQVIFADNDKAAHGLALMSAPENMALVSVYRVELRRADLDRMQSVAFDDKTDATPGELLEMVGLLLHAWDEGEHQKFEAARERDALKVHWKQLKAYIEQLEKYYQRANEPEMRDAAQHVLEMMEAFEAQQPPAPSRHRSGG